MVNDLLKLINADLSERLSTYRTCVRNQVESMGTPDFYSCSRESLRAVDNLRKAYDTHLASVKSRISVLEEGEELTPELRTLYAVNESLQNNRDVVLEFYGNLTQQEKECQQWEEN